MNFVYVIDSSDSKRYKTASVAERLDGIDATALKYKKKEGSDQGVSFTTSQTLHICISNKVKLKEKNFVGAGPLDISFEEGRKKIGRNVFREAGHDGRCFKVTLPNSCKVIGEYAFYDYHGKLHLNEGLERIYLTHADVPKKRMPHVRYKVEKGNKWFYSDKDGEIHKISREQEE